jgi:hypothetical protein
MLVIMAIMKFLKGRKVKMAAKPPIVGDLLIELD